MKQLIVNILFAVFGVLMLLSCSITEDRTETEDKLTVEGYVRENQFAEVFLSNSLIFEGVIDSLEVAKSVESKAKVTLSDGVETEILTLKKDDSRFPFFFYRSNIIKGQKGKKYELTVSIRNKEFVSETTIPDAPVIRNITFLEAKKDGVITPEFKDVRLEIANDLSSNSYYKIFVKNEEEEKFEFARPFIISTENIIEKTFPLIVNYSTFENGFKENLLFVGQVFEIQLVAITKDQFDFWESVGGEQSDIIENAAFSQEVPSNISNGAFGYWSGENSTSIKFKIPE